MWDAFKHVLFKPLFVFPLFAASVLYYMFSGVQFWMTDFMIVRLNMEVGRAQLAFGAVNLTAPSLGVVIGSILTKYIGGPRSPLVLPMCLIFGVLTFLFGYPLSFVQNVGVFILFLWLSLFFGFTLLPGITGVLVSSINNKH